MTPGLGRVASVGSTRIVPMLVGLILVGLTSGAALGCATGSGGFDPDDGAGASAAGTSREPRIVVGAGNASSSRFRARVRVAARGGAR